MVLLLLASVTLGGDEVTESSGLVISSTQPGIVWTNNDSGDGPYLYAFDLKGKPKATLLVRNAHASDWEDVASGPFPGKRGAWLYAGDIGDNRKARTDACIYAVPEPKVAPSSREKPILSPDAIRFLVRYPDGKSHNAECLLCDPRDGRLTIITKEETGVSGVYRLPSSPSARNINTLEQVAQITLPKGDGRSPLITGGAFRPDGLGIAFVTYSHVYEYAGDPWWKGAPNERLHPTLKQCESVAYARDGRSLWFTSEGEHAPLVSLPTGL